MLQYIAYFFISLLACITGAICGIGGGIIIKPALDLFQMDSVQTINFLSGCTVLSMTCYSVTKSIRAKESSIDLKLGTPLAIGAAAGGILGKQIFTWIHHMLGQTAGAVQAGCLFFVTLATMIYTLYKSRVRTKQVSGAAVCVVIGLVLGIISNFLGISGGPVNLIVFYYFFSMDTKTAAQNSLYVIFSSQLASLLVTILTGSIPPFSWLSLLLMVCGGIGGGILGRSLNRNMSNRAVERLFLFLMVGIMAISIYNTFGYALDL